MALLGLKGSNRKENLPRIFISVEKKWSVGINIYISLCSFRIGGNQLISSCTSQGGGTGGCQGLAWEIKKVWQCLLEMISMKSFWNMLIVGRQYMVQWVGSDPVIICRAVQLIHIFLADGQRRRTEVFQEVWTLELPKCFELSSNKHCSLWRLF